MSAGIFQIELLQRSNIERFAQEIRQAFEGKILIAKEVSFYGDSKVHENVTLCYNEYDEISFNNKGVTVSLGGEGPRSMTNSHQVSFLLGELSVQVETRYDPTYEWLGEETLVIRNGFGKGETFKALYITAAPRP